jgi:tetratricopeptide (TPR) repeat protein
MVMLIALSAPAWSSALNLRAPFTPPDLYPIPGVAQPVARLNAIKMYNSGVYEWKNKNLSGAIDCFHKALSFDSSFRTTHGTLGQALYDAASYEEAFRELQIAVQDFPDDSAYWCMLGLAASHVQRYDVTVDAFQKYLSMKPTGGYASEARRSIAILQHTVYVSQSGNQTDALSSYIAEFPSAKLRKWNSSMLPLRVFIADGSNVRGFEPVLAIALREAFNDWTVLSEGRIQFAIVDQPSKAQICVAWTADKKDLGGSDELGVTNSTWLLSGDIQHVNMVLLTNFESPPGNEEIKRRAKSVFLHEIGHALGLSHSQEPWDIMYPLIAPSGLEFPLTLRDKNTLMALYNNGANNDSANLLAKQFEAGLLALNTFLSNLPPTTGGVPSGIAGNPANTANSGWGGAPGASGNANSYNPSGLSGAAGTGGMPPNIAINAFSQAPRDGYSSNANQPNSFVAPKAMPPPPMLASAPYNYPPVYAPQYNQQGAFSAAPSSSLSPRFYTGQAPAQNAAPPPAACDSVTTSIQHDALSEASIDVIGTLNREAAQATAHKDFDGAIAKLLSARKLAPSDQIISRNLGLAYGNAANFACEAGDFTKALENFKNAFEILKNGAERGPYDQIYRDYQLMLIKQKHQQ